MVVSIKDVILSPNTIMKRIEFISHSVLDQLMNGPKTWDIYSLQFDESTDVADIAQLTVIVTMVFSDNATKEEMLAFFL